MTRTTNARLAGSAFLLYIVAGITSMALHGKPHATEMLSLITSFSALVLGVTLYAITRGQDADLALLALTCRVMEAFVVRMLLSSSV
jgi:N-acetylglucosamine-6-phosphate deacetylase